MYSIHDPDMGHVQRYIPVPSSDLTVVAKRQATAQGLWGSPAIFVFSSAQRIDSAGFKIKYSIVQTWPSYLFNALFPGHPDSGNINCTVGTRVFALC
jgi:hypothetical protein